MRKEKGQKQKGGKSPSWWREEEKKRKSKLRWRGELNNP
jgi:hypothetical protein